MTWISRASRNLGQGQEGRFPCAMVIPLEGEGGSETQIGLLVHLESPVASDLLLLKV